MADILKKITDNRRIEIEKTKSKTPLSEIIEKANAVVRKEDTFLKVFENRKDDIILIAEIKKASPSKGVIRENFEPYQIASEYNKAKVDVISVLTEEKHFQGCLSYIEEVRKATSKPILRKDFIIDEYQIYEAALSGADTFLLIAAILDDKTLSHFIEIGNRFSMSSLVEVHDINEAKRVSNIGAKIIGVNNRDLTTFKVDISTTLSVREYIRDDAFVVSESGIFTREDVLYLQSGGVSAILVGESIMRSDNIEEKIAYLKGL